jgi:RNA polymerase sigma-70 factor (ECF subfamily)
VKDNVVAFRVPGTSPTEPADAELLSACVAGEADALGQLFDRYHARVCAFVSRLLGSRGPDVDDLVQATFVEVWRSCGRFRAESSALTWILGIAANIVRHHARSEQRKRSFLHALTSRPCGATPHPDDTAQRRELVAQMGDALAALSPPLKEAFVLCDIEEIPGTEAARALGVPAGTLWRRLHEARRQLRTTLGGGVE